MRITIVLLVALLITFAGLTSCSVHVAPSPYRTSFNAARTSKHYGTRGNYNNRHKYWGRKKYGHRPHGQRGKYH